MIREFQISDWYNLSPNEFSMLENIDVFNDDEYYFYTLDDNGIKAIICFKECGESEYLAFFLIGKDFTNKYAKEIKRFMFHCVDKLKAKVVFTVSKQCEVIRKWHEFLGMKIEKEVEVHNQKFDYWIL